jgi:hypothetical protein
MADLIGMDEFHLTILAPSTLRETDYNAIHRSLNSKRLHERLRVAVRQVLHRYRPLLRVRVRLSR